jgi:hypothetical protein
MSTSLVKRRDITPPISFIRLSRSKVLLLFTTFRRVPSVRLMQPAIKIRLGRLSSYLAIPYPKVCVCSAHESAYNDGMEIIARLSQAFWCLRGASSRSTYPILARHCERLKAPEALSSNMNSWEFSCCADQMAYSSSQVITSSGVGCCGQRTKVQD